MNSENEFYLVLTDNVLNSLGTGYRGLFRADPATLAFANDDPTLAKHMLEISKGDDYGRFRLLDDAVQFARFARGKGFDCEIVQCYACDGNKPDTDKQADTCFLGYDVAEVLGGSYSAVVDRCLDSWKPDPPHGQETYATLTCISDYFNRRLNKNRLFSTFADARMFLRVDRECAERFGGELSCGTLGIIAVRTCPMDK